jgi:hypothetical protein
VGYAEAISPNLEDTTPGAPHDKNTRSRRRGGQRVLDAGVAVVDGNLGSQGSVIRNRSAEIAGSAQPEMQRLNQAQFQRGKVFGALVLQATTR